MSDSYRCPSCDLPIGHSGEYCAGCDVPLSHGMLKVGDRVPMSPKPKLRVYPSHDADVGGKSLRGAFTNGRAGK